MRLLNIWEKAIRFGYKGNKLKIYFKSETL